MPTHPTAWTLERRVTTARGEIAWDRLGDGPAVVLVHGTPSRSVLWRDVAPLLAEHFTVYVFDLLGFGQSERHVEQEVCIRSQGEVLAELVQTWGLRAPAVVGHDIGGATVLRAHVLEGMPARRIVLVDAVVLRPWITATTRHIKAPPRRLPNDADAHLPGGGRGAPAHRNLPSDEAGRLCRVLRSMGR